MQGLEFYIVAYQELQADKSVGMSVGFIPWTSIKAWADHHSIGYDEFETLLCYIREIEKFYMDRGNNG